jgi:hypothetical protein
MDDLIVRSSMSFEGIEDKSDNLAELIKGQQTYINFIYEKTNQIVSGIPIIIVIGLIIIVYLFKK